MDAIKSMSCVICLGEEEEDAPLHTLPCGHQFHFDCILSWAQSDNTSHGSCPICRDTQPRNGFDTGLSWQTQNSAEKSGRIVAIVKASRATMSAEDQKLFDYLYKQYEKSRLKELAHRKTTKDFNKSHREVIRKHKTITRSMYKFSNQRRACVRDIISLFPVVAVVRARGRPPVAVRRSQRLASQPEDT